MDNENLTNASETPAQTTADVQSGTVENAYYQDIAARYASSQGTGSAVPPVAEAPTSAANPTPGNVPPTGAAPSAASVPPAGAAPASGSVPPTGTAPSAGSVPPYGTTPPPVYGTPVQQSPSPDPLSVISMVLGIIGIVGDCCYGFGFVFGIAGLICAIIARKKEQNGFNLAGLICSIVSIALAVLILILVIVLVVLGYYSASYY